MCWCIREIIESVPWRDRKAAQSIRENHISTAKYNQFSLVSSPSFALGETNVKVPIGRDAILNCTVHNSGSHKVAWIDSLRGVVLTVEEDVVTGNPRVGIRHSVTPNGADSWVLSVKAVTMKDAGTYMCQVSTKAGLRLLYNLSVVGE
ncbi:zwei Ig domain protein zig-8-like [Penaeus indicus]|uniref:zwei Ig domain protein zig-8-like n=1 Tax=Penaeus indicus TaxID=29960 RepID=UPI00300DB701